MKAPLAAVVPLRLSVAAFAQQSTTAEMEARFKEIQRKTDSVMNSPRYKEMMKRGSSVNTDSLIRSAMTTTEGFPIYTMPQKIGTWKGYDLYQSPVHDDGLCVVISRGGAVPWKPVTQEEYLKTVRAFLLEQRKKMTAPPPRTSAAEYQHQIDNIQKSTCLKPEEKQRMLTSIRQRQQQDSTNTGTRTRYVDDQVQKIDDYVRNTPANQLQQQAILSRHSNTLFDGKFYPAQDAAHQLVTVSPDYLNHRLPDYRPQFMILYWRWVSDNPASLAMINQ